MSLASKCYTEARRKPGFVFVRRRMPYHVCQMNSSAKPIS